jgi:hypothetical protein
MARSPGGSRSRGRGAAPVLDVTMAAAPAGAAAVLLRADRGVARRPDCAPPRSRNLRLVRASMPARTLASTGHGVPEGGPIMSGGRNAVREASAAARRWGVMVVGAVSLACVASAPPAHADEPTAGGSAAVEPAAEARAQGLGGVRKLDEKRSEALKDKMPQRPEGSRPEGMGGGGPRGGGTGRGVTRQVLVLGDPALVAATYPEAPHVAAKWKGRSLVSEVAGPASISSAPACATTGTTRRAPGAGVGIHDSLRGRPGSAPGTRVRIRRGRTQPQRHTTPCDS